MCRSGSFNGDELVTFGASVMACPGSAILGRAFWAGKRAMRERRTAELVWDDRGAGLPAWKRVR
jgi:hypothetical protein